MYEIRKIYTRIEDAVWVQTDFKNKKLKDILKDCRGLLIEFANKEYPDEIKHIDLSREIHSLRFNDEDIEEVLVDLEAIKYSKEGSLHIYEQKALSGDLDTLNFNYELSSVGYNLNSNIPDGSKNDLYISRENTDMLAVYNQSIFTVNGYCHPSNVNGDGITLRGAGETLRHSSMDSLGIISFKSLGNIRQYEISEECLLSPSPEKGLFRDLGLKFNDIDLINTTPFLVWCGLLLMPGEGWEITGDNSIRIHLDKIGWIDRIHTIKKHIKLDSLLLNNYAFNETMVSKEQLKQDSVIIAALNLTQTFLFTLDVSDVRFINHPIDAEGPGRYLTSIKVDYPLRLHDGTFPAAMKHDEGDLRALTVPYIPRYLFKHKRWYDDNIDTVDDSIDTFKLEVKASGTLVEISRRTPMTLEAIKEEKRRTGVILDLDSVVPDTSECEDDIDYIMTSMENAVETAISNYTREDDDSDS